MPLIILILLSALSYTMFEIFAGLAGGKINDWLAAVLYNGIGAVIPLIIYYASTAKGKTTVRGVVYASLAGVSILLFSILLARIFSRGGTLSYVIPTIYGTAIVLSSIFGCLVLKDRVSSLQIIGLCLVATGVICVVVAKLRTA